MNIIKKIECPCCCGTGQYMEGKATRGFDYKDCTLCNKTGIVEQDIADDFELSLNEENLDEYIND